MSALDLELRVPSRRLDASLRLDAGQTLALMGPNGAGKSTLAAALTGTLPGQRHAVQGRLTLGDRVLLDSVRGVRVPTHRRGVGLMAQTPLLFPHLDAVGNVAFGRRGLGERRTTARRAARRWLDRVGAGEFAQARPWQLSGGQAQTVALARALAAEPELLVLDEPLNALDVTAASRMRAVLRELLADQTAILVTHEILDALTLADRTAILHDGRVVAAGPTRELFTRPPNVFAARLAGLNLVQRDGESLAFRAADVVVSAGEPDATAAVRFPVRVLSLEPRGEHALLRGAGAEGIAAGVELHAEVDVQLASGLDTAPGAPLWFGVPAAGLREY
ncbi:MULTISPECIES: ATP-binding cassette domain-containing protein [Arthrobacter]|uniref:ATP-binding cassette domain-containing protein n=2 Tax=Arthrobacter TaxID=1663 RepID=A0ABU9KR74_9MICC|nr:ATP-binding cassette domain-containing protein [Arthrobacter sp. YJM1]MDP5228345.1 ATP-binding cassette domain-containing protein [Arthrobacter sp. YJM1]